jgi:cytochrome bd-type quinol oxidase subunit 2
MLILIILAVGILLNGFDLGVEILFVALATRRDSTRY